MTLVSTKSRYALHGLAYISANSERGPIRFEEIHRYLKAYAPDLELSESYLAKVFQDISRAGFTEAVPGPRGGYRLGRPAGQIRLIEIIEALDGSSSTHCCLLSVGTCNQKTSCRVGDITRDAEVAFRSIFERETIESLAAKMTFPDLAAHPKDAAG